MRNNWMLQPITIVRIWGNKTETFEATMSAAFGCYAIARLSVRIICCTRNSSQGNRRKFTWFLMRLFTCMSIPLHANKCDLSANCQARYYHLTIFPFRLYAIVPIRFIIMHGYWIATVIKLWTPNWIMKSAHAKCKWLNTWSTIRHDLVEHNFGIWLVFRCVLWILHNIQLFLTAF